MKNHSPEIRTATARDIEAFYGERPPFTMRALVADLDGEIIGIGGVAYYPNKIVAFSEIKPKFRKYKKTIYKAAKMVCKIVDKYGASALAISSESEKNSGELLARMGFVHIGKTSQGDIYQWLSQGQ